MPFSRIAVKSSVCKSCRGECCISNIELCVTDIPNVPKDMIGTIHPESQRYPVNWQGYRAKIAGRMKWLEGGCVAKSESGCVLGDKKPLMCRRYFCFRVLNWAIKGDIADNYVRHAINILRSEITYGKKSSSPTRAWINYRMRKVSGRLRELTARS